METVLVTGSSGFIGSNLCRRLVEDGFDVRAVDRREPSFRLPSQVETHVVDLTTSTDLPAADVVVHLAAHSQVQPVVSDPSLATENVEMTRHVLDEAVEVDAFVVNVSSRDVYGTALEPAESEVALDSPNGYAASKLGSEALTNAYRHTHDLSAASLRLANVYGPMDLKRRVIPIFVALANEGETLTVYGEGKLLDFVHVRDVCDAILATVRRRSLADGEAINVGSGTGTPLTEVATVVAEEVDACPGWEISADRTGDVDRYVADLSKAAAILNFEPSVMLDDGLRETIDWYRERPDLLAELLDS